MAITGYNFYLKTGAGAFVKINPAPLNRRKYVMTGLAASTAHDWYFTDVDDTTGESAPRTGGSATTKASPADAPAIWHDVMGFVLVDSGANATAAGTNGITLSSGWTFVSDPTKYVGGAHAYNNATGANYSITANNAVQFKIRALVDPQGSAFRVNVYDLNNGNALAHTGTGTFKGTQAANTMTAVLYTTPVLPASNYKFEVVREGVAGEYAYLDAIYYKQATVIADRIAPDTGYLAIEHDDAKWTPGRPWANTAANSALFLGPDNIGASTPHLGNTRAITVEARFVKLLAPVTADGAVLQMSIKRLSDDQVVGLAELNQTGTPTKAGGADGNTAQLEFDLGAVDKYVVFLKNLGGGAAGSVSFDSLRISKV